MVCMHKTRPYMEIKACQGDSVAVVVANLFRDNRTSGVTKSNLKSSCRSTLFIISML